MDLLKRLNTRSEIDTWKELIKSSEKAVTEPQSHVHAVFIEIISGKLQYVINRLQYMNAQASTTQTHEEVIALGKVHAAELMALLADERKLQNTEPMDELLYIEDAFNDVAAATQQIRFNSENVVDEDELNILEETLEDMESQIDAAKRQLSWEKRQRLNEKINREDV